MGQCSTSAELGTRPNTASRRTVELEWGKRETVESCVRSHSSGGITELRQRRQSGEDGLSWREILGHTNARRHLRHSQHSAHGSSRCRAPVRAACGGVGVASAHLGWLNLGLIGSKIAHSHSTSIPPPPANVDGIEQLVSS